MLILTRRFSQSIRIGDEIAVTILGVKGHEVRLGIQAPRSVAVHREEVFIRIAREASVALATASLPAQE